MTKTTKKDLAKKRVSTTFKHEDRAKNKQSSPASPLNVTLNGDSNGGIKNVRLERFLYDIQNTITSRSESIRKLLDPRRNIDDDCGYPSSKDLGSADFWAMFDREPIAQRVVEILPDETWNSTPTVFETEDKEEETEFEKAWSELGKGLTGENHFSPESESHPIWEYLHRADVLSGIGTYGVILLGLNDGKAFSEEVDKTSTDMELIYIRVFHEDEAEIKSYIKDNKNPRNGQPEFYNITLDSGIEVVNWTRIVHIVDNKLSNEVKGVPRQRPVYNRLMDLRKLHSGSAEMYWRGAFPGLSIETSPNLDLEQFTIDDDDLRDQVEQYMNSLQRYLKLEGMQAKMLAPTVVDPTAQITVQIEAICIKIDVPKRIFMGSERGELSSSQDANKWNKKLVRRQTKYVSPHIIAKLVNRLIEVKVLPEPKDGFKISWSDISEQDPTEKAEVLERTVKSMSAYVQGEVEQLMQPTDFLTRIMNFSQDETTEIIEKTKELIEGIDPDPED